MIGQSLGRYTIESKLGEGGMGIVYKARDTQLGRAVAIKILPHAKVADPDRKRRFMQEAKAASALNHPHIVTIYDISAAGDTDFIVMEYLAGTTLEHVLSTNGLPLKQAVTLAIQIADALAKAHEAGIIHRDLKPSNVMITDGGVVKILDFGVAKLLEASEPSAPTKTAAVTEEGTAIGTPAYMSPEQAEGRRLDSRSDIFSFGSVLYEMVTGRKAFSGSSRLSLLSKILTEEPAPPSRLIATVPPELEKTILRCLRKDPARRYQTMADLKVALEDLALEWSDSAPIPGPSRAASSSRRWALMASAVVVVGAAAYFAMQLRPETPTEDAFRARPLTSLSGTVRNPSLSPDGNHVVFTWTGAKQDNPDLYIQQIGAGSHIRVTTDPGNDYSPSWSPDSRWIAFLRRASSSLKNEVRLIAPLGGTERKLADIQPSTTFYRPMSISWCPDSTCVLVTDSPGDGTPDGVFAISLETGEKRQLTYPRLTNPIQRRLVDVDPVVSPDGRWLIFRRDNTPFTGEYYRLPLRQGVIADGEPVRLTPSLLAGRPTWTPDSREILFSERGALWRLDVVSGGTPTRLPFVGEDGATPTVARSPDGRQRLVYVRSFADGNVWRVDTSAAGTPATSTPVTAIVSPRFENLANLSTDGQRLAFMSNRSGDSELWVAATDGSDAIQLTTLGRIPGFPRWSPDGRHIAFHSDPQGRPDILVMPSSGGKLQILTTNTTGGAFPSFSRDGQWVYYSAGQNGDEGIWKVPATGGDAVRVTANVATIAIESHDGRELYFVEAAEAASAIWRVALSGGVPVRVLDGVILGAFDVVEGGIYFIDRVSGDTSGFYADRPMGETRLRYFDFATRRSTTILDNLGRVLPSLSASRDGRTIFFSRIDSSVDELMVVDNFR